MNIVLTIVIFAIVSGFGIWGGFRGVRLGLLSLVGPLMGAALVDLWHESFNTWVRTSFKPEIPEPWVFSGVAIGFLAVALIVGYGSSTFIREEKSRLKSRDIKDRISGFLVGTLNGALIASYLLRYAKDVLKQVELDTAIAASLPAQILYDWLPWFVLAIVLAVLVNIVIRIMRKTFFASGKQLVPIAQSQTGTQKPGAQPISSPPSMATAKTSEEREQVILDKINQRSTKN